MKRAAVDSSFENAACMKLRAACVGNRVAATPAQNGADTNPVALVQSARRCLDQEVRQACADESPFLIFDIGANFGQSAELYLAKGHRVVAVEPNPDAAESMKVRLHRYFDKGQLFLEECAVWSGAQGDCTSSAILYVNDEDSEWSSLFQEVGRRFDTSAHPVKVKTITMAALYAKHGHPWYVKIDVEGADGICLRQMRGLKPPMYLSFELNSLASLVEAAALGYNAFKVVAQGSHEAQHLRDSHGRALTHAGSFGEAAESTSQSKEWLTYEATLAECRRLCFVHDEKADVAEFIQGQPHFVDRDFATLRACFPLESRDDENWYDIHCRHSTLTPSPSSAIDASVSTETPTEAT